MVIRIVEPRAFIRRTVAEQRPLNFQRAIESFEREHDATLGISVAVCLLFVVAFGGLVACGLDVVLRNV